MCWCFVTMCMNHWISVYSIIFFIIFNMNRYTYKQLIPLYFSVMIFYKPTIHVDLDLCTFLSWFIQRVVLLSNKYDRSNTDKIIKKILFKCEHIDHTESLFDIYLSTVPRISTTVISQEDINRRKSHLGQREFFF